MPKNLLAIFVSAELALFAIAVPAYSQLPVSISAGGTLIAPGDLPPVLSASHQAMGARMTSSDKAQVLLSGTVTDSAGSRSAQITIQSPGYLSYREGTSKALTFNGNQFSALSGQPSAGDVPFLESLLADVPDSLFLEVASGGSLRRIGSHFRTDDGKAKVYTGPYLTLYAFTPKRRPGLAVGSALQRPVFVSIDEQTGLIAEVRTVVETSGIQSVVQTQFSNWIEQANQWFPGKILRIENGKQTLSFQTQQTSVGAALAVTAFQP